MLPFEPEDTSLWDDAVERRMDELFVDSRIMIDVLSELDVLDQVNDKLELIALRQLGDEIREAAESRAEDMAAARHEMSQF